MWPFPFKIAGVPVYSYGICQVLAIFAVAGFGAWWLRRKGAEPAVAVDAAVAYPVAMFALARIPFVLMEEGFTARALADMPLVYQGGLWGGPVFWMVLLALSAGARRFPVRTTLDFLAPSVVLALGIGKIGCFLGGCCWGIATDLPLGLVRHPEALGTYPPGTYHPVPLYDAVWACLVFAASLAFGRKTRKPGSAFLVALGLVAAGRFATEFLRYDYVGKTGFLGLYASQWIEAAAVLVSVLLLLRIVPGTGTANPRVDEARLLRDSPLPPGRVPAGAARRLTGFAVDSAPAAALAVLGAAAGGEWPLFCGAGGLFFLVHAGCLRTPGQVLLGMELVDRRGLPASFPRRLLRACSMPLTIASLAGVLRPLASSSGQSFHDAVAGAFVSIAAGSPPPRVSTEIFEPPERGGVGEVEPAQDAGGHGESVDEEEMERDPPQKANRKEK
jgi:phosphatidylglycerol---prolipoprotein diacylglyceryl transferase